MNIHCLRHCLLVATPSLKDPLFSHSVIYLFSHSQSGAEGFIINKMLPISNRALFKHLKLNMPDFDCPIFIGGPLKKQQLYMIEPKPPYTKSSSSSIEISSKKDRLVKHLTNSTSTRLLLTLGYASWKGQQLEDEISKNKWLIAPYDSSILFDTAPQEKYSKAIALLGIESHQLTEVAGHA